MLHNLWPTDPSGIIIMKVLTKYRWINNADGLKEKVAVCTAFFNGIMRENAGRAVRGELTMSFEEQELLLKDVLVAHGISSSVPLGRIPRQEPPKQFKRNGLDTKTSGNGAKRAGSSKFQMARVGNLGVCYGYNDSVCKNPTKTEAGCKDSLNREFAHNCNQYVIAREAYCLGKHPRNKHV